MKYRHQYHAGNFADVHKHVLLLEVLRALTRKDKGLLFVDTHAGRGDYDLHPGDAQHPAEWQAGVAKLLATTPRHAALTHYRELVAAGTHGGSLHYPGSPLLAARTLRPVDRAVFFETQREEAGQLRKVLPESKRARVEGSDGFQGLRALLPPPERRGFVLIDPPYEERADFTHVIAAVKDALARFESAVLLLWLPVKLRSDFDAWLATLRSGVDASGARFIAVDASLRFTRRTQWLGAGAGQCSLSSRTGDAPVAAGVAGAARRATVGL